jgi:HEAT repeat protein
MQLPKHTPFRGLLAAGLMVAAGAGLLAFLVLRPSKFQNDSPDALLTKVKDHDITIHSQAVKALAQKRHFDFLVSHLSDSDHLVRGSCVMALTGIGDPRAIPFIAQLEHEPDPWARRWVAFAMRQFNNDPAAKAIQERMKHDPDGGVRLEATGGSGFLN